MALKKIETNKAAMFEDLPRNLTVPKALGMQTVLLVPRNLEETVVEWWEKTSGEDDHIDFVTDDLADFLKKITA
jgi:putative hydrolase of the HAD superfamily